jgi:hypothetical protein
VCFSAPKSVSLFHALGQSDIATAVQAGHEEAVRQALGYLDAWRRLHTAAPDRDCANSLLALAGAIRGIRWMSLPPDERARIAAEARRERSDS